jgi:peptide/nickel transport system permease protein
MILRALRRSPLGLLGVALLMTMLLLALGADFIAPYDPAKLTGLPFERPTSAHLLGTNDIGQDILSELIFGTRISLLIGVLAAAIAVVIGTTVGLVAGYYRGILGQALMRLVDVVLIIPFVPLMVLLAAYLGQNIWNLIVVIGLLIWARPARVIPIPGSLVGGARLRDCGAGLRRHRQSHCGQAFAARRGLAGPGAVRPGHQ